ncbi:MAG: hypothetical protein A3I61_05640 [Acidobacteria bacterium RIFCSPLOWO2_02_FULL_68_18]|nr:MAG: hypothetical protein A3I61_05640 [Acidobacteria bacterium RIFCSPLOWO2_02_FULL_68_18]OFW48528.1 MAG: hypothetical protein A3G77_13705 [Acidobacteria bacterium RIFCSPLOWO2_12_FULL_68_19]
MTPTDLSRDDVRAGLKRWLDTWKVTGPLLEQERAGRLAAMSPQELQEATRSLLDLWQPAWTGDDGQGLLLHQRIFGLARAKE